MSNSFGKLFKITTFGESHGGAVGVVIDGCPSGYEVSLTEVQIWLDRRRPGQSHLSSPRNELDQVECLSGLLENRTLGTPITLIVKNKDFKKEHYNDLKSVFRPSHADFTTVTKYGVMAASGGGRASARETIGRVAAASIAEQILKQIIPGFETIAYVDSVKDIVCPSIDSASLKKESIENHPTRCPDKDIRVKMEQAIIEAKKKGDSVGGTVYCLVKNCPDGLGDPVFDKLEANLAKAMMSLPATKGFEIGSGFSSTKMYGSEHNDAFYKEGKKVRTTTNNSGGVQGGISNGEEIYFRVAFKPVATIFKNQDTIDSDGNAINMKPKQGRHDPCVVPRAVPIVEAMTLLVLMDHYLRQLSIKSSRNIKPFTDS